MQVQQDPPVNIMVVVSKKCEEMKREMLAEVETIRDQTRGDLAGAAMQMRTLQEAMTNQQTKMSKVEEVISTTAASAAADQKKNARHGGKNDATSPTQMWNWKTTPL